jgi:hypothetical protein
VAPEEAWARISAARGMRGTKAKQGYDAPPDLGTPDEVKDL